MIDLPQELLVGMLLVVGLLAGIINTVAGGGSFLIFPALLALGVDPLLANATNNTVVFPGNATALLSYRHYIRWNRQLALWIVLSAAFALCGGYAAVTLGSQDFLIFVPILLAVATVFLLISEPLTRWSNSARRGRSSFVISLVSFAMLAVYGGFFGAGFGIVALAILPMLGYRDLHRAIGMKIVLATTVNAVAAIYISVQVGVHWAYGIPILVGTAIGGRVGGYVSQRVPVRPLRYTIAGYGAGLSIYYAIEIFG